MVNSPDITPGREEGTGISRREFLKVLVGVLTLGALEACSPIVIVQDSYTETSPPQATATETETPTPQPSETPKPTATATEVKPLTLEEEMKTLGIPLLPGETAMAGEPNLTVFKQYLQDHGFTEEEFKKKRRRKVSLTW